MNHHTTCGPRSVLGGTFAAARAQALSMLSGDFGLRVQDSLRFLFQFHNVQHGRRQATPYCKGAHKYQAYMGSIGYYGTQYRVRLYPPFGYRILYKEYYLTRFNHQKKLLTWRCHLPPVYKRNLGLWSWSLHRPLQCWQPALREPSHRLSRWWRTLTQRAG